MASEPTSHGAAPDSKTAGDHGSSLKKLYLEVSVPDTYLSVPQYAVCALSPRLLEQVTRLRGLCTTHGLTECRIVHNITWDGEDELRISEAELVVSPVGSWFSALPRHGEDVIETLWISHEDLDQAFTSNDDPVYYGSDIVDLKEIIEERLSASGAD